MSLFIKFYFTSSLLNMFRTLIHPSSGACDFSVVSPHWSCVLVSMCVGVSVWLGWGGIRVAGWSLPHGRWRQCFLGNFVRHLPNYIAVHSGTAEPAHVHCLGEMQTFRVTTWRYLCSTCMRRITMFRWTTDHIYDGGPKRLWYHIIL